MWDGGEVGHVVVWAGGGAVAGGEEPQLLHQVHREQEDLVPGQQLAHAAPLPYAERDQAVILHKPENTHFQQRHLVVYLLDTTFSTFSLAIQLSCCTLSPT